MQLGLNINNKIKRQPKANNFLKQSESNTSLNPLA